MGASVFFFFFPGLQSLSSICGRECHVLHGKKMVLMKSFPFVMPQRGNESGCNLVFHFSLFIATHTRTHTYTLQCTRRASRLGLHSGAFILTWMSVLCLSKMCSASPVFPLQIGSQIKLSSTGSGAYKHTRQAEWLVMTFQTFTTTPFPKPGLCGQSN